MFNFLHALAAGTPNINTTISNIRGLEIEVVSIAAVGGALFFFFGRGWRTKAYAAILFGICLIVFATDTSGFASFFESILKDIGIL